MVDGSSPVRAPGTPTDAAYVEPECVVRRHAGVRTLDRRAAAGLVRALLRVRPEDRASLDDAVASLEVMLFVLPGLETAPIAVAAVERRCVAVLPVSH